MSPPKKEEAKMVNDECETGRANGEDGDSLRREDHLNKKAQKQNQSGRVSSV